jgi:hypothetical protein
MFAREKLKTVSQEDLLEMIADCEDFHDRGVLDSSKVRTLINEEAKKCNSCYSSFMNSVINDIYREAAMRWKYNISTTSTQHPNPMYAYHDYVDKHLKELYNDL